MTVQEFSNEFDILYNNIMSNQAPGLDEYEKSVFLTQAQEVLIMSLYSGQSEGFENTEALRRFTNNLIKTYTTETSVATTTEKCLVKNSKIFPLPADLWFITYEAVSFDTLKNLQEENYDYNIMVVPIIQDELHKIYKNPFRAATDSRVLRLDRGEAPFEFMDEYGEVEEVILDAVELISTSNKPVTSYLVRYLAKPSPIIITDLGDLSINGISAKTECALHSGLHREILLKAVQLAAAAYKS